MTEDVARAIEAIRRLRGFRDAGKVEAVLRGELLSWLRLIFPATQDQTWINHYSEGTEAATKVGTADGLTANRFIDNLVGSTTIEYEADLRVSAKFEEGQGQVREHASGLIRTGVPASQVRGILSDTVTWHAWDIELAPGADAATCQPTDIRLREIDGLDLDDDDEAAALRLIAFVRKHLAREQSRSLLAEFLTIDLGLHSGTYERNAPALRALVEEGRGTDTSITLATDLWSLFVDYLEGESGAFRLDAYVDEVYLCVLARLLSANVLAGQAIASDEEGLKSILDGSHFADHYQLANMVEQDYFGWLTTTTHIDKLVPVARAIQHDLYAYDFSRRPEEDIFGRLMTELARRSRRRLLGQEWTPAWLAKLLAERCIENLPRGELPRIVDMCCGSGSIIAEVIKTAKIHFGLSDMAGLHDVATGFDIDPLAVTLAKTTWVVMLADEIRAASAPISIPIFHADSLFAVTPVTALLPFHDESGNIELSLDGSTIHIPMALVEPEYRELFDRIVDWCHDEAMDAREANDVDHLTRDSAHAFLTGTASLCNLTLDKDLEDILTESVHALACRMAELAIAKRNGLWAFILRNTYRPGLLSGQFNGLVSNPPWLALSALADNPYKGVLEDRAQLYGIRPSGQSFLHLELATTHLLHAVDRYLSVDASVACLVPGTIFNGHHHEPFRQRGFLSGSRKVAFEIAEAWQVEPGTFKYPGAAIIGRKRSKTGGLDKTKVSGFLARESGLEQVGFSMRELTGERTAWVLEEGGKPVGGGVAIPQQGADLMPRTAVCIEIIDDGHTEHRVDTPLPGTDWGFTVKAAKELKGERFPRRVAPAFIYRMAQSEILLPFLLGGHRTPVALPAQRNPAGEWTLLDEKAIRGMGFTETARGFRAINEKLADVGKGKTLQERIDERRKLSKQVLGHTGSLVLTGAGGKTICAACLPVSEAQDLVVDQTLYWQVIPEEERAWFLTGMLNSDAMTRAIAPFNPKGAFGERHIHTLPYRLMPPYDTGNEAHKRIAVLAEQIAAKAEAFVADDDYLNDPNKALSVRRRKLREVLTATAEFVELETLCASVLGASVVASNAGDLG